MFVKELYAEQRRKKQLELIVKYPFGALATTREAGIEIDHFPFTLHPEVGAHGVLRCHVDRSNSVWQALARNGQVVVAFQSPNAYISPNWMPGRQRHRKTAPSWNYAAVHVHGTARAIEDAEWLKLQLAALAHTQEHARPEPWTLTEPPPEFIAQLLNYIVGVEVVIERIVGKWFVGQHRTPSDRAGVVSGLRGEGTDAAAVVASMMEEYAPPRI